MGHTKIIQSGDFLEIYEYEKEVYRSHKPRKRRNIERVFKVVRRYDNLNRTKKTFQRLCRSNFIGDTDPALITLTMFEVVPLSEAYSIYSHFIKRLRKEYGKSFRYVGVPEFQKRGAVHFHVLFWGLPRTSIIYERVTRYYQNKWGYGYVDCKQTDGSPKLSTYLSKYMLKALSDKRLGGEKAFMASRNALRPVQLTNKTAFALRNEIWLDVDSKPLQEHEFTTEWLGRCNYKLYKIK